MTSTDLKRLGFLETSSQRALDLASSLYANSKQYCPESLKPRLQAAESKVVAVASPYTTSLVDKASGALKAADSKVDSSISAAWQTYSANSEYLAAAVEKQRAAHAANLEHFQAARKAYLQKVEESVSYVKEQGLQGTAKAASEALLTKVQEARQAPAALLGEINKHWHELLALPPVAALLEGSRKQVNAAFATYAKAHDVLVASPTYNRAVVKGSEVLKSVQATTIYQTAAARLYPLAAPLVEPALKTAQPYISAVATHLAPVAA